MPSVATYNAVINGLCGSGRTEQGLEKLNELLQRGLVPDETTYNMLIHAYCKEGDLEKAFQFS